MVQTSSPFVQRFHLKNWGWRGINQVTHLTSHYPATLEANPWPGYNNELDPTHPCLPSLKPLPKVLLGSGMEVFISLPQPVPPLCC